MKKIITGMLVGMLSLSAFAQKNYMTFEAKIDNKNGEKLYILGPKKYKKEFVLNKSGIFKDTLNVTEGMYRLSDGVENTSLFLKNGMDRMPEEAGQLGIFKDRGAASVIVDNVSIKRIPPVRPESPSEEGTVIESLVTEDMTVRVDADFPRVIDYTMADGKIMYGQASKLDMMVINGVEIIPEVTSVVESDNKNVYSSKLVDEGAGVNAILTAEFVVKDNSLEFNITEVNNLNED